MAACGNVIVPGGLAELSHLFICEKGGVMVAPAPVMWGCHRPKRAEVVEALEVLVAHEAIGRLIRFSSASWMPLAYGSQARMWPVTQSVLFRSSAGSVQAAYSP